MFKFDVSARSDLSVYLFYRKFDASMGHQVTSLGFIKLNPFLETWIPGEQWLDVQDGTGRIRLEISYLDNKIPPLEDSGVWNVCEEIHFGDLIRVQKRDTDRAFAMTTICTPNSMMEIKTVQDFHALCPIDHPFIAPLEFVFKSSKGLSLLSPIAGGGHLFSYLQRELRFGIERARAYAAELSMRIGVPA